MSRQRNRRNFLLTGFAVSLCGLRPLPANVLINGGFEEPAVFSPGNNFPPEVPGWTLVPSAGPCENGHNIVLADGSNYDGGPNRAAEGSQYYDICGAAGYLSQSFTIGRDSLVFFGASFSRRDTEGGGGNVAIYNATETTLVAAAPLASVEPRESQEIWKVSSASIPNLPAGTYVFRINLDDTANVDAAFLYNGSIIDGYLEAGNGTPGSVSEGLLDWAMATGPPIILHGGNVPYVVPLTTPKVISGLNLNGRNLATLSGQGKVNIFRINPGGLVRLRDITLDRGFTSGSGGAISNQGTLELNNVRISNCVAGAHGGALQNSNILTCNNCIFEYNRAGINGGALDTTVSAILGGCVATNNAAGFRGGGFYNYLGYLATGQCVVKWNTAGAYGGGVAVDGGTLRSTSDRIRGNRSNSTGGGMTLNGDCIVRRPNISLNIAVGAGGAADIAGIQTLLEDAEIHSNQSGGGAITIRDETTVLMRASIMYNTIWTAPGIMFGGGGVVVEKGAAMIYNSRIDNNSSSLSGGAVTVAAGQQAILKNCAISNNSGVAQVGSTGALDFEDCQIGPGLYVGVAAFGGTLTMSRSTVYGNGAQGIPAGGLRLDRGATATITNSTISGNYAVSGGGLNLPTGGGGSAATLTNVTIFGNSAQTGGNVFLGAAPDVSMNIANCIIANPLSGGNCAGKVMTSSRYSISSDSLCVLAGPGDRNGTNPMLSPLQNNGGPTLTHLPLAGSPAIDGVPGTQAPAMDQRGKSRPAGSGYDIGAVEVNGTGGTLPGAPPPANYDGIDRGDDDGDGFPDVSEMIAGTDPNSARSSLRLVRSPRDPFEFAFQSQPGVYYRLYQSRDDQQNHLTQWVDAGMGTITGDGLPKTIAIAPAPGVRRRFYVLKARILNVGWP